jgi:hypothetical protein
VAGQIKQMLDQLIEKRAKGNPVVGSFTAVRLTLKGINVEKYNSFSPDDPDTIARIRAVAAELGVSL